MPFPWNDGSGSPVDVGRNRNVRLGNNRDKENSLTKKLGLHAFVNLHKRIFRLCVVFCSEGGLSERVLLW